MNNKWLTDEEHRLICEKTVIACVDCLVICNGNYLLLKRTEEPAKGEWWFPGGRILKNETFEEATKRVCLRELGKEVQFIRKIDVFESQYKTGRYGLDVHWISAVVICKLDAPNIRIDESHSDIMWVPFDRTPEKLNPELKKVIQDQFFC